MKRWILAAAVLGVLNGCQDSHEVARQQSIKRWYSARAQVMCELGSENLKVGQLDAAAKAGKEALAMDKDCVGARVLLGKVFIEQGQYTQAERELQAAKELKPSSAEAFYLLGVAQEKSGELEDALASYRQSLVLDPDYVEAIIAIGEVLAEMGKPEDALAYVEANMKLLGDQPGAYELAGRLAMMLGDYPKAQRYCQLAHDLDSRNPYYLEALARAQLLGGRLDLAEGTLKELSASEQYRDRAWVHLVLGDCMLATGRAAEAREQYLRAGELAPDSAAAWAGLAKACLATSDMQRASLAAAEALKADGLNGEASMVLGYALIRSKQADKAISVLARAAAAHPEDAVLRCLLGRAYAATGNQDRAKECYDAAMKLEPGNELAKTLLADAERGATTPK